MPTLSSTAPTYLSAHSPSMKIMLLTWDFVASKELGSTVNTLETVLCFQYSYLPGFPSIPSSFERFSWQDALWLDSCSSKEPKEDPGPVLWQPWPTASASMELKPLLDPAEGQGRCSGIRQIHTEHGLNQKRHEKPLGFPTDALGWNNSYLLGRSKAVPDDAQDTPKIPATMLVFCKLRLLQESDMRACQTKETASACSCARAFLLLQHLARCRCQCLNAGHQPTLTAQAHSCLSALCFS